MPIPFSSDMLATLHKTKRRQPGAAKTSCGDAHALAALPLTERNVGALGKVGELISSERVKERHETLGILLCDLQRLVVCADRALQARGFEEKELAWRLGLQLADVHPRYPQYCLRHPMANFHLHDAVPLGVLQPPTADHIGPVCDIAEAEEHVLTAEGYAHNCIGTDTLHDTARAGPDDGTYRSYWSSARNGVDNNSNTTTSRRQDVAFAYDSIAELRRDHVLRAESVERPHLLGLTLPQLAEVGQDINERAHHRRENNDPKEQHGDGKDMFNRIGRLSGSAAETDLHQRPVQRPEVTVIECSGSQASLLNPRRRSISTAGGAYSVPPAGDAVAQQENPDTIRPALTSRKAPPELLPLPANPSNNQSRLMTPS
eukprot:CAMPEP_0117589866 /NCGR_PEP_ID=MMETSP0784-20121206/70649_1 /TAXON_ID=39447 /ORGANISM="" /LENGTH=373 /DNA_ID=CAMNT_0005391393 /DNA_START=87 /DNA_END=1210 /DNA_ORIENTATION=-